MYSCNTGPCLTKRISIQRTIVDVHLEEVQQTRLQTNIGGNNSSGTGGDS